MCHIFPSTLITWVPEEGKPRIMALLYLMMDFKKNQHLSLTSKNANCSTVPQRKYTSSLMLENAREVLSDA